MYSYILSSASLIVSVKSNSFLAKAYPYREWLNKNRIDLATVSSGRTAEISLPNYKAMVTEFGYTKEDIDFLITRNKKDFIASSIPVFEPQEFIDYLLSETSKEEK